MMLELLPYLVALFFVVLFLSGQTKKYGTALLPWTDESFFYFEKLPYGKIWCFDNTTPENEAQIPWVFIHSIGSSIYSWRYQIDVFSPKQRILAFDLLGFGQSDKPSQEDFQLEATAQRVMALLDQKGVSQCHLIGCSLGGALSLWLKAQAPERFDKVVAIAPAATPLVVPFLKLPHDKLAILGKRIVSRPLIQMALHRGLTHKSRITTDVIEHYFLPYQDPEAVTCFLKSVSLIKDPRIYKSLSLISSQQVLLLWGARDRVIPSWAIQLVARALPKSLLKIHPEGGHHLMEDEPEWLAQCLAEFLEARPS
jgi:2-hydroxymuconate-semialdehyde hydrolase